MTRFLLGKSLPKAIRLEEEAVVGHDSISGMGYEETHLLDSMDIFAQSGWEVRLAEGKDAPCAAYRRKGSVAFLLIRFLQINNIQSGVSGGRGQDVRLATSSSYPGAS
eukprot:CAMPEP_0184481768 /NCGR_PEP_ID=MMETSP0113_2-20130426/3341_1 /TAXON_ID=91329 /ORGANISM="Norrisiella sphaerica, Strain BC52" /LENGTH=107 /DNA_ID=CAMNT_0026861109 /DNA_START=22 /DNA_END=346 /DNA_ORIENTATION=-